MTRSEAVVRINDALGFRPTGHSLEGKIVSRLLEAQRDLEKGKTLPKFLLQEDQDLTLLTGEHDIDLPTGFIRLDEDNLPHFRDVGTLVVTYIEYVRSYSDAVKRATHTQRPGEPAQTTLAPRLFTIRKETIDFITLADRDYEMTWNYYKAGALLTTDVENEWLEEVDGAPEWLIGEAGWRIARDLRDQEALQIFDDMRTKARAATFGDMLADEDAGGPLVMGATL